MLSVWKVPCLVWVPGCPHDFGALPVGQSVGGSISLLTFLSLEPKELERRQFGSHPLKRSPWITPNYSTRFLMEASCLTKQYVKSPADLRYKIQRS